MPSSESTAALRTAIDAHLADHDREGAIADALAAVENGRVGIVALYRDVLGPLLIDTGAAWQDGGTAVWEEHLTTATVRTIVEAMAPEVLAQRKPPAGTDKTVVLACPPEEQHELGLRMAADLYALGGWQAHYLGADTPEDEIAAAAWSLKANLVVLTASTHYHRLRLREVVDRLAEALPNATIQVGGAAFSQDHSGWSDEEVVDMVGLWDQALAGA